MAYNLGYGLADTLPITSTGISKMFNRLSDTEKRNLALSRRVAKNKKARNRNRWIRNNRDNFQAIGLILFSISVCTGYVLMLLK